MNELTRIEKVFEGQSITAYLWEDKPVWIAKELGRVMGYSGEGERLTDSIRGEWKEELIVGQDFELLEGERLALFKNNHPRNPGVVDRTSSLLILKEPGFHLVCIKSGKPIGIRLRRWLAEEVLPSLVRTGSYQSRPRTWEEELYALRPSALIGLKKAAERGHKWAIDRLYPNQVPPPPSFGAWEEQLVAYVSGRASVSVPEVLWEVFGIPPAAAEQRDQNRAAKVLRLLGWERSCVRAGQTDDGRPLRQWRYFPPRLRS